MAVSGGKTVAVSGGKPAAAAATTSPLEKPNLPEYEERRCLNLYSESELLRSVAEYINDCMLALGYEEDTTFTNARLGVTGLACAIALVASVALKFPQHAFYLGIAVALFFSLLFLLFLMDLIIVKNSIMVVKDRKNGRFFIDAHIERWTGDVALSIRTADGVFPNRTSVGNHFDEDGFFVTRSIFSQLKSVLNDFTDSAGKKEK